MLVLVLVLAAKAESADVCVLSPRWRAPRVDDIVADVCCSRWLLSVVVLKWNVPYNPLPDLSGIVRNRVFAFLPQEALPYQLWYLTLQCLMSDTATRDTISTSMHVCTSTFNNGELGILSIANFDDGGIFLWIGTLLPAASLPGVSE